MSNQIQMTGIDDHPAAHSMDTTWFAVDADGYVGAFDTGVNGVLPWRAPRIEQVFEYAQASSVEEARPFHPALPVASIPRGR